MQAEVVHDEAERTRFWELADRVLPVFARYRRGAAKVNRDIPIVQSEVAMIRGREVRRAARPSNGIQVAVRAAEDPMDTDLTDTERLLRDTFRGWFTSELAPQVAAMLA